MNRNRHFYKACNSVGDKFFIVSFLRKDECHRFLLVCLFSLVPGLLSTTERYTSDGIVPSADLHTDVKSQYFFQWQSCVYGLYK